MKLRVLSFLLLLPVLAFPQEYSFRYYFDHGPTRPVAFSIFEDKKGFLWFCMNIGVHRFDGVNMKDFKEDSEFLKKGAFSGIEDSRGNYWFGTLRGIVKFDGTRLENFEWKGRINRFYESKDGTIWGAGDKGIARYYKGKWTKIKSLPDGSEVDLVRNVAPDKEGKPWFLCRSGILRPEGASFSWFYEDEMSSAFAFDKSGRLWFATKKNLMLWDGSSINTLLDLTKYNIKRVYNIFHDSRGNIWLCTDAGLFRYKDGKLYLIPVTNDSYFKSVFSITESSDGVLWAGMLTGICKMVPKNYEIYDASKGLNISLISGISQDNTGSLWLYSYKGGTCRLTGNVFSNNFLHGKLDPADIISACPAKDGSVLFGGTKNGTLYRLKNGILSILNANPELKRTDLIKEGPDKRIWFQSSGKVYFYDGTKTVKYSKSHGFSLLYSTDDRIWLGSKKGVKTEDNSVFIPSHFNGAKEDFYYKAVAVDNNGYYWLSIFQKGILRYSPWNKTYVRITSGQGLIDNSVTSMTFDKNNNLWIGTKSGLSELNVSEYNRSGKILFKNFGSEDGFPRCNSEAIYCDKEGNVWVGVLDKLVKITSEKTLEPFSDHKPGVYITNVSFLYDTTNIFSFSEGADPKTGLPVNLRLPYNKNYLQFSFTGIDYRNPEGVQYRYKLNGQDYNWSGLNRGREVAFRNLEPGEYTFSVIARNKDGLWSQEAASFTFRVMPPFWRTWWFYLTVSVLLISFIFTYIRFRTSHLEKLVALRTQELNEEKQKVENINSELEKSRYQLTKINELQARWLDDLAESERYLKEVNSSKDKFFSIISHDLKSPFNALLTYSESLVENIDQISQEELRDFTVKVSRYSRNVYNLIENLLDWSRMQTGRMEYSPREMGMLSSIREVLLVQEAIAQKKKITIVNLLTYEIPVFADRNMVMAILNNFISNAIKFTWPGGKIEISAVPEGGFASLSISDNGTGMEESEIEKLFKIDSHFFKNGTSGERGTGLGLILCKELIEKNGGFISVESKPGIGSTFRFSLPLA
ncbi:MAG TPA: two-component regulator propeller domain-containing protein [Ignavibacteriales bacterium]|nr:two-component regulator propeller domain-containing protein [Ignavibacteriales bacterium]